MKSNSLSQKFKTFSVLIVCILAGILLIGCDGEDDENFRPVGFIDFKFKIPKDFSSVDPNQFENQQIENKVVQSLKRPASIPEDAEDDSSTSTFQENIIITQTQVDRDITSKEYGQLNIEKIDSQLRNSKVLNTQTFNINCDGESIESVLVDFQLENSYFTNKSTKYYLSQIYILNDNTGYIVSFAGKNSNIRDIAKDSIGTIQCY